MTVAPASLNVAIIGGGPSAEAEVSRASARGVLVALGAAGCRAEVLELDADLPSALRRGAYHVVFPVTHGPLGEDGCLQGLLEVLGMPYVGSGPRASALAAHKPSAKILFRDAGLPVARGLFIGRDESVDRAALHVARELGLSVILKPASGGSAIGVVRLPDASVSDIERGLARVFELDDALVECFHPGREVTCGVLEGPRGPEALPPTLIEARAADWYDFRSRYQAGGSKHTCPAPIGESAVREVQRVAVAAHRALGARDLSRVDFVVDASGVPVLLEVNTLPGMTQTSNFPEAAAVNGITFPELCLRLCQRAWERPRRVTPTVMNMPVPDLSGPSR